MTDIAQLGLSIDSSGANAATTALGRLKSAATDAASAHQNLERHAGNSRLAMLEFEHVIRATVDDLAAGANPMRILAMEGARLAQAFQMSGGAAGALSTFGGAISRLLNPTVAITGALAAMGAVGVSAFVGWENRLSALQTALNGLGRSTGMTLGALNRVALGGAGGPVSVAQAQSAVATLANTGRISPEIMSRLLGGGGLIERYSRVTGTGFSEATSALAGGVANPVKGAGDLARQYGGIDQATLHLVSTLQAAGHTFEAQNVYLNALGQHLANATETTWSFARAWAAVTATVSNASSAIGAAIQRAVDPTTEDKYAAAVARYRGLLDARTRSRLSPGSLGGFFFGGQHGPSAGEISAAQGGVEDLGEQMRRTGQLASLRGRDAAAGQTSLAAERISQESSFAVRAALANTGNERTSVEAQRAFATAMTESNDKTLAATSALAKWNEAIADSNRIAEDALRTAQDQSTLAGLRPYQRARREVEFRYRDLQRQSTTGPLSMLAPGDLDFNALDDSGGSIRSFAKGRSALAAAMQDGGSPIIVPPAASGLGLPSARKAQVTGATSTATTGAGGYVPSTSSAMLGRARGLAYGAVNTEQILLPLREEQDALDAQNRLLQTQRATWGQMPDAITAAMMKTKLLNDEIARGIPITGAVLTANEKLAKQAGQLAHDQESFRQQQDALNSFNDTGRQFVGGAANDVFSTLRSNPRDIVSQLSVGDQAKYYAGQLSGNQVKSMVAQRQITDLFRQMMFNQGVSLLQSGLFGQGSVGSAGYQPGLLGGLASSLFGGLLGGGGGGAGQPTQLSGAAGGSGGGLFGSLFSGIGHIFGLAEGGVMGARGPLPLRRYSYGGVANSPQLAMFGEGSRPEAYVPLADGRTIPVTMKQPKLGGGPTPILAYQGGDIHFHGGVDSASLPQVQAIVAEASRKQMQEFQRNAGNVQAKWSQRHGA